MNGTAYVPNFFDPQYVIPPGNYLWELEGLPDDYAPLKLPFSVSAGDWLSFESFPAKVTALKSFSFSVAAENIFARSSHSDLTHDANSSTLLVAVSTETEYDWWGYFVLPGDVAVREVCAIEGANSVELDQDSGYTTSCAPEPMPLGKNPGCGYKIVVVRIAPTTERLELTYCPLLPGDISEDCYIDFFDFAEIADRWLECSDPCNPGCS
jgi:hypothetical protein